ncbi:LPXTG cell wall anchor domain-containing protein [Nocardioides kongjuensis]|uniref:LPXTG cell wall anchor domain-containing protein n=1 Tax=Nocardioides kongjuensis TaxID=349522 RepID=UPI0035EFDF34
MAGSSTLPNTGSPLSPALILFAVALLGAGGVLVARSQRQAPRKSRGGVRCPPRG